jgi:Rps23 Pro-64 3,4-dihydroxylase Tpa1-like proline 4-hydroxylase
MLQKIGEDDSIPSFHLTDKRMTRFVMTLEQSVDLIDHAIEYAESGDIVIPKLISCNVSDLIEIFSEIYNKPIVMKGLRPGEKLLESLINETQSIRLIEGKDGYKYIKPSYKNLMLNNELKDYNSTINPLSKEELRKYLEDVGLIEKSFLFQINEYHENYNSRSPFPHLVIENILPESFAFDLQNEILNIPKENWDRYQNPFENKYTLRDKNKFPRHLSRLFGFLSSDHFVSHLSEVVGTKLYLDPTKNWWGVHTYDNGDFLDIHVDAGQHPVNNMKKHITLGIYLSKDWKEENGGHLELWSGDSSTNDDAKIYECKIKVLPSFNKLILFTCNDYSWHGNPEPVIIKKGENRIFVTISYTSDFQGLNDFKNQRKKAFFVRRPNDPEDEEKDRLRILRADPEKYKDVYRIMNINK